MSDSISVHKDSIATKN